MPSPMTLTPITAKTKGEVKRMRLAGYTPVSIQHKGMPTEHYQQETRPLNEWIARHGEAAMVDIETPGHGSQRAIMQTVQRNPISNAILTVTFQQIRTDDTLKTFVSLVFQGEPEEARLGDATVQHQRDRLEVACAQADLPDHITVNVADLRSGGAVRVSDLPAHPKYKILAPPDTMLASLSTNRATVAAVEEAAAPA